MVGRIRMVSRGVAFRTKSIHDIFTRWDARKLVEHITNMLDDSPDTEFTVVFKDGTRCKNEKQRGKWMVWDEQNPTGGDQNFAFVINYVNNIKYAVDKGILKLEE